MPPTPRPAPMPPAQRGEVEVAARTAEICVLNEVDADLLAAWPKQGAGLSSCATTAGRAISSRGRAAASATTARSSFVATLPQARRQGHAGRIVARLLADAAADGCTTATLSRRPRPPSASTARSASATSAASLILQLAVDEARPSVRR